MHKLICLKCQYYRQGCSGLVTALLALTLSTLSQAVTAYDINGFTLSGDIRTGWVQYDYDNPDGDPNINKGHQDSKGFYVVPKLSLTTPSYKGFSGKITAAGATDFGLNNEEDESRNFVFDPDDRESFTILQELYLQWQTDQQQALVGRKEFVSPMIEADDYYMLANSFAMGVYDNRYFTNTSIKVGYFAEMAGVWDSGANGTKFRSMSDASFVPQVNKDEADDKGVYFAAVDYDNELHRLQVWNYYADELYNTFFSQYDYVNDNNQFNYNIGLQFINFSEVGKLKSSSTEIDYSLYSIKFDGAFDNGITFASGASKYSNGEGTEETLGAWGGFPYFANGMIFHFFEAGSLRNAESYKLQAGYDFTTRAADKLSIALRYTRFELDPEYSISSDGRGQDLMHMAGVRVNYKFLRNGYFTGTFEQHSVDHEPDVWALRLIGGFTF